MPGDLCWVWNDDTLWPSIVVEKFSRSSRKTPFALPEPSWDPVQPVELSDYQNELNTRLYQYGCERFEYKVTLLPLPTKNEIVKSLRDYDVYPFNFTTEPLPMDDSPHYNRALIQAIQIQSSWAVPKLRSLPKPVEPLNVKNIEVEPPIRNPIHIGCPSVSGNCC